MSQSPFINESESLLLHTRMLRLILSDHKEISISESSFKNANDVILLCTQIITTIVPTYTNDQSILSHLTSIQELVSFILSSLHSWNIALDTQLEAYYLNDLNERKGIEMVALLMMLYVFFHFGKFPYEKLSQLTQGNQFEMLRLIHSSIDNEKSGHEKIIKYLLSLHWKISFLENRNKNNGSSKDNNNSNGKKEEKKMNSYQESTNEESLTTKNDSICYRKLRELSIEQMGMSDKFIIDSPYMLESPIKASIIDMQSSKKSFHSLTEQDYLKIIMKKDFIINQLESQLEQKKANEKNIKTIKDEELTRKEEELEYYKKENQRLETRYEMEFELMASAMYNLGLSLYKQKEETNLKALGQGNWLMRQRQSYLTGNY